MAKQNKYKRMIYRLRISLIEMEDVAWREIEFPSDRNLAVLHSAIQAVMMGWMNCHMHQFIAPAADEKLSPEICDNRKQAREAGFFMETPEDMRISSEGAGLWVEPGEDEHIENDFGLDDVAPKVGDSFLYVYDLGDCWAHLIEVMDITEPKPGPHYPRCLAGENACPPEDCGGSMGYDNFLKAIADKDHEEHEWMLEWVGGSFDPKAFDLDLANARLSCIPGATTENTDKP